MNFNLEIQQNMIKNHMQCMYVEHNFDAPIRLQLQLNSAWIWNFHSERAARKHFRDSIIVMLSNH